VEYRPGVEAAAAGATLSAPSVTGAEQEAKASASSPQPLRVGLATYSLWQFRNPDYRSLEKCIDLAAEWGFDGVDILRTGV
jgi:hypothetical protein